MLQNRTWKLSEDACRENGEVCASARVCAAAAAVTGTEFFSAVASWDMGSWDHFIRHTR